MRCVEAVWLFAIIAIVQATPVKEVPKLRTDGPPEIPPAVTKLINVLSVLDNVPAAAALDPMIQFTLHSPDMYSIALSDLGHRYKVTGLQDRILDAFSPALEIVPDLEVPLDGVLSTLKALLRSLGDGVYDNLQTEVVNILSSNKDYVTAIIAAAVDLSRSSVKNAHILMSLLAVAVCGCMDFMLLILNNIKHTLTPLPASVTKVLDIAITAYNAAINILVVIVSYVTKDFVAGVYPVTTILGGLPIVKQIIAAASKAAYAV